MESTLVQNICYFWYNTKYFALNLVREHDVHICICILHSMYVYVMYICIAWRMSIESPTTHVHNYAKRFFMLFYFVATLEWRLNCTRKLHVLRCRRTIGSTRVVEMSDSWGLIFDPLHRPYSRFVRHRTHLCSTTSLVCYVNIV